MNRDTVYTAEFDLASEVLKATDSRMADHLKSCQLAKELKARGINVRTNFQYFGWVAVDDNTYDGPGSPLGMGNTEQEAIEDLNEQIAEQEERRSARIAEAAKDSA